MQIFFLDYGQELIEILNEAQMKDGPKLAYVRETSSTNRK